MATALDSCDGLEEEAVISPIVTVGTKVSIRVNVRRIFFISLRLFTNDSIFSCSGLDVSRGVNQSVL